MNRNPSQIVVIGAGLSGLTAARTLRLAGADPIVLERHSFPGGRAITIDSEAGRWEPGAQFFANLDSPTVRTIASELSLNLVRVPGQSAVARADGPPDRFRNLSPLSVVRLAGTDHREVARMLWQVIHHGGMGRGIALADAAKPARVDRRVGRAERQRRPSIGIETVTESLLLSDVGSTPEWLVPRILPRLALGRLTPVGGIGELASALATGLDIRLNHEVNGLHVDGNRVMISVAGPAGTETLACDLAICAVPAVTAVGLCGRGAFIDDNFGGFLETACYSRVISCLLVFDSIVESRASSLLIPRQVSNVLGSVTWQHLVHPGRWPAKQSAAVAIAREPWSRDRWNEGPTMIASVLADEVRKIYRDEGLRCIDHDVYRWPAATPLMPGGRFAELEERLGASMKPPVMFCGDYLSGSCIEGAVVSGARVGRAAVNWLTLPSRWP